MDPTPLLALLTYAAPLVLFAGFFIWRGRRAERRTRAELEAARVAGLDAPASVHPYINPTRCLGCESCIVACPEDAVLGAIGGKAVLVTAANCVGHGACRDACPTDAIVLVLGTEERGVEVPILDSRFETNLEGLFVVGELGGMGLIRNAIEQGRQVIESVRRLQGIGAGEDCDVVIVGAGPSGFAATLAAKQHGLRSRTLEQDVLGGAVAHYPRNKLVLTSPIILPMVGRIKLSETTKEALLELWHRTERETGIQITYGEKVTGIEPEAGGFSVTTANEVIKTTAVVLAIGRRGSPRKLEVAGEELPKVAYTLDDPADHAGQGVLVVGAGDSAIEAALAISAEQGTEVTLSCRGDGFPRAKPANRVKIEEEERRGRICTLRNSSVAKLTPKEAILKTPEGELCIGNDAVIVCIGGELPFGFLAEVGVETETRHGEP